MSAFTTSSDDRWLFCFTHPDDEISIVAWIRRLIAANAHVHCGWSVTNETREAEARRVMKLLGVPPENLHFLRFPDGSACEHLAPLSEAWKSVLEVAKPTRIVACAFECGHLDHDSTNYAVHRAASSLGIGSARYEVPLYHTYLTRIPVINRFADPNGEEVLHLDPAEANLKLRVSRMYPSQNIASLLVWYTILNWLKLRPAALCKTERLRPQTHFDYSIPNLPPALKERVQRSEKWKTWLDSVRAAESQNA